MRDFELEASHGVPIAPERDIHAPTGDGSTPFTTGRSSALDAATLMHLQRTAGNAGVVQLLAGEELASPVHDVVGSGGGSSLDEGTRTSMESAFGQSFEDVRIHTDDRASKSAESVGANAYTVGSDVVFKSGQYDPGSTGGQRTLAHELSHVVQQSQGAVDGAEAPGGIRVSDPSDRFRARRRTDRGHGDGVDVVPVRVAGASGFGGWRRRPARGGRDGSARGPARGAAGGRRRAGFGVLTAWG